MIGHSSQWEELLTKPPSWPETMKNPTIVNTQGRDDPCSSVYSHGGFRRKLVRPSHQPERTDRRSFFIAADNSVRIGERLQIVEFSTSGRIQQSLTVEISSGLSFIRWPLMLGPWSPCLDGCTKREEASISIILSGHATSNPIVLHPPVSPHDAVSLTAKSSTFNEDGLWSAEITRKLPPRALAKAANKPT